MGFTMWDTQCKTCVLHEISYYFYVIFLAGEGFPLSTFFIFVLCIFDTFRLWDNFSQCFDFYLKHCENKFIVKKNISVITRAQNSMYFYSFFLWYTVHILYMTHYYTEIWFIEYNTITIKLYFAYLVAAIWTFFDTLWLLFCFVLGKRIKFVFIFSKKKNNLSKFRHRDYFTFNKYAFE